MANHRRPQANFKVSLDRASGKYQVVAPDGRILAVCDSLDAAVTRAFDIQKSSSTISRRSRVAHHRPNPPGGRTPGCR